MRIGYISSVVLLFISQLSYALEADSVRNVSLSGLEVVETRQQLRNKNSTLRIDLIGDSLLRRGFTGNFVQNIAQIPGVHSMDIGSGFSKPMIRGMGFNRITVVENGVKQEGQQWGADHGLEIDAFNTDQVSIKKGSSSLLHGSDAMGGVIEITQLPPTGANGVSGEVSLLTKTVNDTYGGSLMLGIKRNNWFAKVRYSHQDFGDYRVPTDSINYLTVWLPINGKRMKNTAGRERSVSFFSGYRKGSYESTYALSNVYQKVGFFPGAHGIPDPTRLDDDGDSRNIDMPFSKVNHFKASTLQRYSFDDIMLQWNLGYQNNKREEWSLFHTHYGKNQPMPEVDPDKELSFSKDTYSSNLQARLFHSDKWEFSAGWDVQYQHNTIGGYSFLLPRFNQFSTGASLVATYRHSPTLTFNGGLRYDYGTLKADEYLDTYLEAYLKELNYKPEEIDEYKWRSHEINRNFGNYSASIGLVWNPERTHLVQVNIGRSFRMPTANELASNGIHHGAFRHERGDGTLSSERGWQIDASYTFEKKGLSISLTPFASLFENYIYLRPSGEMSILKHAGQIYQYTGAEVFFAGGELSVGVDLPYNFHYKFGGEYVYGRNNDEKRPLAFSPPSSISNTLTWSYKEYSIYTESCLMAEQSRVAQNEDGTKGWHTWNGGATANVNLGRTRVEITLSAHNILNKKYYNHLSFYRKVEVPEPGRNFQLMIKIPFSVLSM